MAKRSSEPEQQQSPIAEASLDPDELREVDPAELADQGLPVKRYQPDDEALLRARSAAYNRTYGPIHIYRGPKSMDEIYEMGEPVVVVADMIPMNELTRLELTRVRGFVFEEGSATKDDDLYNFLMNENRAAVIGCKGALYFARNGEWVIVDGVNGVVCFNPSEETVARFQVVRADGVPERDEMQQVAETMNTFIEDAIEERIREKEAGKKSDHDHMSKQEAIDAHDEGGPGLVLTLLSGLPIPGTPGYQPPQAATPGGTAEGPAGGTAGGGAGDEAGQTSEGAAADAGSGPPGQSAEGPDSAEGKGRPTASERRAQREAEDRERRAHRGQS
ncbi:hypothetical protein ACFL59_05170 [Planctomycetota bacterium]